MNQGKLEVVKQEMAREEEWRFIPQALTIVRARENIAFLFIVSKDMESGVK